jgi:hypothetical protein
VCCNFKECLKLLREVVLITKMNTVIGKYIKVLIFSFLIVHEMFWTLYDCLCSIVLKLPADYCKNSLTMSLMTQNTTKVINAIFTPKYGECTIALFYSIITPLFRFVFISKISVSWSLDYLILSFVLPLITESL